MIKQPEKTLKNNLIYLTFKVLNDNENVFIIQIMFYLLIDFLSHLKNNHRKLSNNFEPKINLNKLGFA